jgi:ParB/RepB/Spo0J family partition protein
MTTPSEIAQQSDLGYHYIPLAAIDPSPTNPRKHFDKQKLDELAESIVRLGVLQPIVVRPRPGDRYEIVAGERRYRAARQVAFEQIPCTVRDLDDKATLEVQVVENLQRDDLHPLEEAEGYAALLRDHGYDADTLAQKIGKSRSYVYARLKLMELCPAAKKALLDGVISHSVGLLIARIPDAKLQAEATEVIAGGHEPLSYRRAFEHIGDHYMLKLNEAPWKRNDADLLPSAGACSTCAFRTGNQKELFGDVKSADVCTKPPCYQAKMDAHWTRITAAAKEEGLRVLPASEEKAAFSGYGGRFTAYGGQYVDVDSKISYDSKKTYRAALGTKVPQITVAREPATGKVMYLLPRKVADGALVAAGLKKERASASGNDYLRQQKAEAAKRKIERAVEAAIIAEMRPLLAALPLSTAAMRIFTKAMALENTYRIEDVFKRRGIEYPKYEKRNAAIVEFVDGLSDGEMVLVGAELQLNFTSLEQRGAEEKTLVRELAALVGVDAAGIEKRMRAEAAAKAAKKTSKVSAKPAKKRAAKKAAK